MCLFLSFSPQWTIKRPQTSHVIKVRSFGPKLVNSVNTVTHFAQHGKLATRFILTWAPRRHVLRYKVLNTSSETAEPHPSTYGCRMEPRILHATKDGGFTFYHNALRTWQPIKHKDSHFFALFVSVLTTLCMLELKVLELFWTYLWAFFGFFLALWIKGKCTIRHVFSYREL